MKGGNKTDKKKHNGWANYDTWLVVVWLDNDQRNYNFIAKNKSKLLKLKKASLFLALRRNCKFGDPINWSNVHSTEIKDRIRDN